MPLCKTTHRIAHFFKRFIVYFGITLKIKNPDNRAIAAGLYVLILTLVIPLGFKPSQEISVYSISRGIF